MKNLRIDPHSKCNLEWVIIRKHNKRVIALKDLSCTWKILYVVHSKEKLKNLLEKRRLANLQYIEGLAILKTLREPKNQKEKDNA